MRFDKDVLRFITPVAVAAAVMFAVGWFIAGAVGLILGIFIMYFFRDPRRESDYSPDTVMSPADGKVVGIEVVEEPNYIGGKARRISIFLSLLNAHMNYSPISGTVEFLKYQRGRYLPAQRPRASKVNARNAVGFRGDSAKILVNQIAGVIARRIVCRLKLNDQVSRGQKFGLMRFGSRVEVYLPLQYKVTVEKGQSVRGALTPLAERSGTKD